MRCSRAGEPWKFVLAAHLRARVMRKIPGPRLQSPTSSDKSGGGDRLHHDRDLKTKRRKGKRNAERRNVSSPRQRRGSALKAGARSPLGVPPRLSSGGALPPNSAPGQASWDLAGAFDLIDRQPGEDRTPLHGRYPRQPVPVQRAPPAPAIVPAGVMPRAAREPVTSSLAGTVLALSTDRRRLRSLNHERDLLRRVPEPTKDLKFIWCPN
jgi:hypothetical protein